MQGSRGARRVAAGGAGHWIAAPRPPRAQGGVSCGRVIGSWDLQNDTVDYFTAIMSQGNLVTALHSHVHAQPRRAHGWRHIRGPARDAPLLKLGLRPDGRVGVG